jgi:hypothetical protein
MTTLEQAEQLRIQAIDLLLAEKALIDNKLASLSYDGEPRTRKAKSCGTCGAEGHTARTCTVTASKS